MEEPINQSPGIEEISEEELRRIEYAQQMFIKQGYPIPRRRLVGPWDILGRFGLEVILRLGSTIGAALVSATAVGAIAKITMILLQKNFDVGQDLVSTNGIFYWSMMAFEGYLMATGITEGRKDTELKDSKTALIAGFAVTIAANLLRSFTLLSSSGTELALSFIYGIAIAVAGPIIAYHGSRNFGHILQEIQNLQAIFDSEWQGQLDEWKAEFDKYFVRVSRNVYQVYRGKKDRSEQPRALPSPEPEPEQQEGPSVRSQLKHFLIWKDIPPTAIGKGLPYSPTDIANMVGVPNQAANSRKYLQGLRKEYDANPAAWIKTHENSYSN